MVCVMCLIPLFLIPIVNLLPALFDVFMGKLYRLLGWEYRKPERAPPACPMKPSAAKTSNDSVIGLKNHVASAPSESSVGANDCKID